MMNERIRQLLVEAREQTREGKWHAPTAVWAEKFAELIVRECMAQCNDGDSKYFIAKHFGVEDV
jgi:hypothetical protein